MEPDQIIHSLTKGQTNSNWIIFPYNKTRSVLMLLYKLFFTGLLLGLGTALFVLSAKPLAQDTKFILMPLGTIGTIGFMVLLHHIYTMFFLKSNMIVLTENEVVKSVRGKIFSWNYKNISNLKIDVTHIKNSPPVYSVLFHDSSKNGKIFELARGREFGPAQSIYEILKTKVS